MEWALLDHTLKRPTWEDNIRQRRLSNLADKGIMRVDSLKLMSAKFKMEIRCTF